MTSTLFACGGNQSSGTETNAKTFDTQSNDPVTTPADTTKSSQQSNGKVADESQAKEFTKPLKWESEGIELSLPADSEGNLFSDCGLNCMVTADCFDADVVSYHEYDKQSEATQKTVGKYTYDFQSFDYLGIKDWHMFVIKIAFTESRNQMEHRYYKIIYTVYGEDYPVSQVEKFMETLHFTWFD